MKMALIQCNVFSTTGKTKALIYTEVKRWDRRRGRNLPPSAAEAALGNICLCFVSCSSQSDIKARLPFWYRSNKL